MVHIIGGNLNYRLLRWLKELSIEEWTHIALDTWSIDRIELKRSATNIAQYVRGATALISVGLVADLLLIGTDHGTLPATNTKDKKKIERALVECRRYLVKRNYYGNDSSTSPRPPSSG